MKLGGIEFKMMALKSGHLGLAIEGIGSRPSAGFSFESTEKDGNRDSVGFSFEPTLEEESLMHHKESQELKTRLSQVCSPKLPGEEEMFKILVAETIESVHDKELSEKQLLHLHRIFGHLPSDKLSRHSQASGYADKGETKKVLEGIQAKCKGCCLGKKKKPRSKFSLPKIDDRNQVVTLDLKECSHKQGYILYMIDSFSRYIAAELIPDKMASTIAMVS